MNPRKCMRCGKCTASCPAFDEMDYHPHQFVSMVENGRIDELLRSRGIYLCLSCFACVERCPRNVEPAKLIEAVRLAVIRQQGENHLPAEKIPQLLDDELAPAGDYQRVPEIQASKGGRTCRKLAFLSAIAARTLLRRWTWQGSPKCSGVSRAWCSPPTTRICVLRPGSR